MRSDGFVSVLFMQMDFWANGAFVYLYRFPMTEHHQCKRNIQYACVKCVRELTAYERH